MLQGSKLALVLWSLTSKFHAGPVKLVCWWSDGPVHFKMHRCGENYDQVPAINIDVRRNRTPYGQRNCDDEKTKLSAIWTELGPNFLDEFYMNFE